MATQYTSILKLALPVQGELSGTWGDVVNDNITSMVEEAIAGRKVINTWTTNSHTLTTADGTTSESRAAILTLTDTGTALTGAGTVICPAASKIYIVENGTGQTITVKTSSGTGVAVPNTKNMVVFCDGTNVEEGITNINSLTLNGDGATVSSIKDEDNMASDSATALATQQSIKAYVDSQVGANNELSEVLANGNTTGGTDISVSSGDDITFADSSKAIFGAGSDLQIYHNGSNSYIDDAGTGSLVIRSNAVNIGKYTGETAAVFTADGSVQLRYDNSAKFETTNTGVDVTGDMSLTDTSPAITFNDSSVTNLSHKVNSSSDNLRLTADENNVDSGSRIEFFVTSSIDTLRLNRHVAVFNEGSADIDFRVESNTSTHMLFVDGGTNRVGVNNSAPAKTLHVSQSGTPEIRVQNSDNNYALDLGMATTVGQIKASADLALMPGGIEKWRIDTSGNVTQTNSGAGAGAGPYLNLYRDSASPADGDALGLIQFQGEDSAGNTTNYATINSEIYDVTDGTEDGRLIFKTAVGGSLANRQYFNFDETIFNEDSNDIDFRVESDSNSHMLFVDAGNNFVGINKGSPETELHVKSTSAGAMATFESSSANSSGGPNIRLWRNSASPADGDGLSRLIFQGMNDAAERIDYVEIQTEIADVRDSVEDGLFQLETLVTGTSRNRLLINGSETVFNDGGRNLDFRVESDSNSSMFVVDAGNDRIGVGESAPESQLHIKQTADIGTGNTMGLMIESGTSTQRYMLQTGRTGVSNAYFNLRDVSNSRDIWSVLDTDGTLQGHTPFQWNNAAVFNDGSQDYDFRVESAGNENMLFVDASMNAVGIGHNTPLVPFHVKSTGSGEIVRIESTNADASQGPILALYRNSSSPADNDGIGRINFLGEDSAGNQTTYNYINATITDVSNGTEDSKISMGVLAGGAARSAFILDGGTGATFNEDGIAAHDFRVESDSNANMLFVDASGNQVGVGKNPSNTFDVNGSASFGTTSTNNSIVLNGQQDGTVIKFEAGGTHRFDLDCNGTGTDNLSFNNTTGAKLLTIYRAAEIVVNEDGASSVDFRAESDNNANMLFVDAGNDAVGIGAVPLADSELTIFADDPVLTLRDSKSGSSWVAGDGLGQLEYYTSDGTGIADHAVARIKAINGGTASAAPDGILIFETAGYNVTAVERMRIGNSDTDAGVTINEGSYNQDFRVESNSNTQALLVDAGGDFVAMGNTVKNPVSGFADQHGFGFNVLNGDAQIASDSLPLELGRTSTAGANGMFLQMRAGSTAVGALRNVDSDLVIHTNTSAHTGLRFGAGYIAPTNNSGAVTDDAVDLGLNTARFNTIKLSDGVQFGNSGAAAELLDDYEEGTWTPTITRSSTAPTITYTNQLGSYTKIGRTVHITGYLAWSANSGGSGDFRIASLPFNISTGNANYSTMNSIDYGGVTFATNGATFGGYGATGQAYILLLNGLNNGGNSVVIGGLASSGFIYFDMTHIN